MMTLHHDDFTRWQTLPTLHYDYLDRPEMASHGDKLYTMMIYDDHRDDNDDDDDNED